MIMFDSITGDGRLWAVRYEGMEDNILYSTFHDWLDLDWLEQFFMDNLADLQHFFHITDVDQAIYDSVADASRLQSLILDVSPSANLDAMFKHLENNRTAEMPLGREKAKGQRLSNHQSWLRLYALKIEPQVYIITGGAIKLTYQMEDRQHTLNELIKLNQVRDYLMNQGIADVDGFNELNFG